MKKRGFGRKFSRDRGSRRALFRSLLKALIEYGKINTGLAKAKAIRGDVEKLVNLAKDKSVNSVRRINAYLGNDRRIVNLLLSKVLPSLSSDKGGYIKITNLPRRKGDFSQMVRIEWIEKIVIAKKDNSKKAKKNVKKEKKAK